MDPARVSAASAAPPAAVASVLKAAAAASRAKTAQTAAAVVKRKRGALQDISNSHTRGTHGASHPSGAACVVGVKKPTSAAASQARGVKRSASSMSQSTHASATVATTTTAANVRVRGAARGTSGHTAGLATKRRRENTADDHPVKVQTKLLSFKSIAPQRGAAAAPSQAKPLAATTEPDDLKLEQENGPQASADPEMECNETLKPETSQPEPTPTAALTATESEEVKIEHTYTTAPAVPPPVAAAPTPQAKAPVPPYEPRPYMFKFDHKDSGFDEATYRAQVRDIDAPYENSAIHCVKIARDMDRYHRQHEDKYQPAPDYMGNVQLDINEKMRTILVDWLVEVGEEYELDSQTFHKTVNLVDRCLAKFKINRKQFQLLGCACMMIAAKFEEVYGPNVEEFVYISDQTYTSEEMLEMEMKVLQALEYRIASTTCHGFLPRFTRAGCTTDKQRFLVQYLCDFAMLYYHMLQHRPSMLAAAAVYLSRLMTNEEHPWTPTLHHFTQFNAWELKDCVMDLYRLHRAESEIVETQRDKAKAVSEKYVSDKFLAVSTTPSVDEDVLEKSFLAYEQPQHMSHQAVKQDASSSADTSSSTEE